jgi:hypothetical protein
MVVDAVIEPEVPVIVTVDSPVAAVALAAKVTTLEPAVGLVLNDAVTPLGSPDAASVMLPVNPPESVTVMLSGVLAPWARDIVGDEDARVKLGVVPPLPLTTTLLVPVAPA